MQGTYYVDQGTDDCRHNDKVFVVVDEVNRPTGIWEGRLVSLEESEWHLGRRVPAGASAVRNS